MARGKTIRLLLQRPLALKRRDEAGVTPSADDRRRCPPLPPPCLVLSESQNDQDFVTTGSVQLTSTNVAPAVPNFEKSEPIIRHLEISPREIIGLEMADNPSVKRVQLIFGVDAGTTKDHITYYALARVSYFQQLVHELTIVIHWADRLDPPRSYIHVSPKVLLRKQIGESSLVQLPGILTLRIGERPSDRIS